MEVSHAHRITSCETRLVCCVGLLVVVLDVSVQHRAFASALALPNAVWPFFVSVRESALSRPGRQYLAFVCVCVCVCVKETRPWLFFHFILLLLQSCVRMRSDSVAVCLRKTLKQSARSEHSPHTPLEGIFRVSTLLHFSTCLDPCKQRGEINRRTQDKT